MPGPASRVRIPGAAFRNPYRIWCRAQVPRPWFGAGSMFLEGPRGFPDVLGASQRALRRIRRLWRASTRSWTFPEGSQAAPGGSQKAPMTSPGAPGLFPDVSGASRRGSGAAPGGVGSTKIVVWTTSSGVVTPSDAERDGRREALRSLVFHWFYSILTIGEGSVSSVG